MMDARLEEQVRVSKMLGVGFACTLLGAGGITSAIAFIIGLKARGIIKRSQGEITGLGMAWWCIIVGAVGMIVQPLFFAYFIIDSQTPAPASR